MIWKVIRACFVTGLILFTASTYASELKYSNRDNAVTQSSEDGEYNFTLYSSAPDLPLKKIHSWILHIEDKNGKPVEKAKVFIFGGMPMHKHGFPTKPRVKKYLGNGDYMIEGVKFNMPGHWQMRFNIKVNNKSSHKVPC